MDKERRVDLNYQILLVYCYVPYVAHVSFEGVKRVDEISLPAVISRIKTSIRRFDVTRAVGGTIPCVTLKGQTHLRRAMCFVRVFSHSETGP